MNWKAVARDVLIVMGLTFFGGIPIGFLATSLGAKDSPNMLLAIALSNFLFALIGFTVAGCLARTNRFRHLLVVTVIVWVLSIANVFLLHAPLINWFYSLPFLLLVMGLGGAVSFLFVKKPTQTDGQQV
ncbi:MAG: hypothetical protein ACT4PZ_17860 [Panacagrimonas sp.]